MTNPLPRWFRICLAASGVWLLLMPPFWMMNTARRTQIPISSMWIAYRPDFLLGAAVAALVPAALLGWRRAAAGLFTAGILYAVAGFVWGTAVGVHEVHMYAVFLLAVGTWWFQRASNKPVQPTRAARPNRKRERPGSGPRG